MKKKGYGREVFANIALISQLGISMMVPIFLLLGIGIYLESKTDWFLTVPFLILGILAGCRSVYILVNKATIKTKRHTEIEEEKKLVNEAIEKWNKNK